MEAENPPDKLVHNEQELKPFIPASQSIVDKNYSLMPDYKSGYLFFEFKLGGDQVLMWKGLQFLYALIMKITEFQLH